MAGVRIPQIGTEFEDTQSGVRPARATFSKPWFLWFQAVDAVAQAQASIQIQDDGVDVGIANPAHISFDANLTVTAVGSDVHVSGTVSASSTFIGRRSSDQTSGTTVIMNIEDLDDGNRYDTSTGIYTAGAAGIYLVVGCLTINNTSGSDGPRTISFVGSSQGTIASFRVQSVTGEPVAVPLNHLLNLLASEQLTITVDIAFAADVKLTAGTQQMAIRSM